MLAIGLVLLAMTPLDANAQVLKGLGKKIEKKVEQQVNRRVDRRVDNAINKGMDKVEDAAEGAIEGSGKNEKPEGNGTNNVPMRANNVSIAGSYDFTLGLTYNIRSGKEKPLETTLWFSKADYMGMSTSTENNMFMIMHNENIITFMEKEKNYMVIGSGMMRGIANAVAKETQDDSEAEDISIEKIGTERFLNYNCDVYEVKSSEYTSKIWVTQDLDTEAGHFMKAFSTLVKDDMGRFGDMQDGANGIMLKMEGMNVKDNEVMIMETTAIHEQGLQFDTSEYTSVGF